MKPAAWMVGAAGMVATGCLLDTQGSGIASDTADGSSSGSGTTTELTSSTTDPSTSTTSTSTGSSSTSTGGSGSTGIEGALLVVDQGATIDFGTVQLASTSFTTLTLRNVGTLDAAMVTSSVAGDFTYRGGAYPGEGGTCGGMLAVGEDCALEVEFTPTAFGNAEQMLVFDYDDGIGAAASSAALTGVGVGTIGELLVNPGGEDVGAPPPGWTSLSGGWQTTTFFSFEGARSINAGDVNGMPGLYRLVQVVDVSGHALAIDDASGLEIELRGRARTLDPGDDPYSIALRFVDDQGALLDEQATMEDSSETWTEISVSGTAPAMTRTVEAELRCNHFTGEFCSSFFDALDLTLTYPASG